jgi:hypothetical protein
LVENKQLFYEKGLHTENEENLIEYKKAAALAKREARRRKRNSCEKFVTNLEHDLYRTKLITHKIIKHLNKEIKEDTFLQYF